MVDIRSQGLGAFRGEQRARVVRWQQGQRARPCSRRRPPTHEKSARTRSSLAPALRNAVGSEALRAQILREAESRRERRTAALLGTIAGSVDAAGFTCLGGLLPSHLTASLVVMSASLGEHDPAELSARFAMVPVFVASVAATRWLARMLSAQRVPMLRVLLVLLSLGLCSTLGLGMLFDGLLSDHPRGLLLVGGLGVASMAVQNATMRLALPKLSPTTVMTGNLTQLVMATADLLTRRVRTMPPGEQRELYTRFASAGPPLAGFVCGSALCGYLGSRHGLSCLAVPAALSLLTTLLAWRDELRGEPRARELPRVAGAQVTTPRPALLSRIAHAPRLVQA